jgi:hypothetical protein
MTDSLTLDQQLTNAVGEKIASNGLQSTIEELGLLIAGLSASLGPKEIILNTKCGTVTINNQQSMHG